MDGLSLKNELQYKLNYAPQPAPKEMRVTWDEYERTVEKLAVLVHQHKKETGWDFDQIICIARGGMLIGDIFSRLFKIDSDNAKPLGVIFSSSYRKNAGQEQEELKISDYIAMTTDSLGKRILLVDDLLETGQTMTKIKQLLLKDPNVEEVKTAVLWDKGRAAFQADFCVAKVSPQTWIYQPFEKYDEVNVEALPLKADIQENCKSSADPSSYICKIIDSVRSALKT